MRVLMLPDIMLKTRVIRIMMMMMMTMMMMEEMMMMVMMMMMMMMMVKMMMMQRKGGETAKKTKTRQLSLAAKSRVDPLLNPVAPKSI